MPAVVEPEWNASCWVFPSDKSESAPLTYEGAAQNDPTQGFHLIRATENHGQARKWRFGQITENRGTGRKQFRQITEADGNGLGKSRNITETAL